MNHAEKFLPCGFIKTVFTVLLTMAALSWPVAASGQGYSERNIPSRQETFRIGIVSFMHETCTFCPEPAALIVLHGAMAVVGIARPEDELLRMVRNAVGPDVVLIVTLDLHAYVDAELVAGDAADAVFSVKRFPHYDDTLTGQMAADVMIRTLQGTYNPVVATRKPGIIIPGIFQSTAHFPARDIMEHARRWENREPDVYVSVNFGFAYADVPDNGASIFVVTNNNPELANRIAGDMSEYFWRHREAFVFQEIYNIEDGVRRIMQAVEAGRTPGVVADGSDRTGGATWITNVRQRNGASVG